MARWSGEMEFEFIENDTGGSFVATDKVVAFLRQHLAKGEVADAVRLYEDMGQNVVDELLAEARVASSNTQAAMAEMFVGARDFARAGQVFELSRDLPKAAAYYEQGQDFASAARCYEELGDLVRAGLAHDRAGNTEAALDAYRRAGPSEALAQCLYRQKRYADAAGVYRDLGNVRGEIDMLQLVPVHHDARVPAALRLCELLEQYGHPDRAVGLLVDTIRQCDAARMHQPMYMTLARLLDGLGKMAEAAQVRARIHNLLPAGESSGPATASSPIGAPVDSLGQKVGTSPAEIAVATGQAPAPVPAPAPAPAPGDPFANLVDPFDSRPRPDKETVDAYAHLKSIPIFAELALEDMRDLYRTSQQVRIDAGQLVIEQGQRGNGLTVVLHGDLQVSRVKQDGATVPLARLGAGAYVGDMSFVDDSPTSARVVAVTPVTALFISKEAFAQFLYGRDAASATIYKLFAKTLAERLRQANAKS